MSGQAWKYSDQLDDMDLKMMKRDFFTYKIGMDYYGFSIRPLMRIAREAGVNLFQQNFLKMKTGICV